MATGVIENKVSEVKSSIDKALEDLAKIKLSEATKQQNGYEDPILAEAVQDPDWQNFVNAVKVNGYDHLLRYEEELMIDEGAADPKGFMKLLIKLKVSDDEQVRLHTLYKKKAEKLLAMNLIGEGEVEEEIEEEA